MKASPVTMLGLALALRAAEEAHPSFGWLTAPSTPNGRFHIDHTAKTIYVDGRLDILSGFLALIEAIDVMLGRSGNVVPLHRRLAAAQFCGGVREG